MVLVSALHAGGLGFNSRAGIFPNFFLSGYLLCGNQFVLCKFNCKTLLFLLSNVSHKC